MKKSHPGMPDNIGDWKGQEIVNFQEELRIAVNGHISEKWFYLHMKSETDRLPRIDVLNLLSRYAGYVDWNDFRYKHGNGSISGGKSDPSNRLFLLAPLVLLLVFAVIFTIIKLGSRREFQFCFINQLTRQPLTGTPVSVWILKENESPEFMNCDSNGCFSIRTGTPRVRFVVKSPYYRTDTITRILNRTERNETIPLRTNDYALMFNYLSHANIEDWKARREHLDAILSDDAMIYQVFVDEKLGMELYNKWEFINKITLPSKSLRDLEIIEMTYREERISKLWFKQVILEDE
jgi:hypothetical protein